MNDFKRAYWILVWMNIALFCVAIAIGTFAWSANRNRANEGKQSHDALCLTRENLEARVKDSRDFLKNGGHIPGVSDAALRRGIKRDQDLVDALEPLNC